MPKATKEHSFRGTVVLVLSVILIIFFAGVCVILQTMTTRMLAQTEERFMAEQAEVVLGLLQASGDNMKRMSMDIGFWDETVAFALGENPGYLEKNWPGASPLENYTFQFMLIQDVNGVPMLFETQNYVNHQESQAHQAFMNEMQALHGATLQKHDALRGKKTQWTDAGMHGFCQIGDQIFFLSIVPIVVPGVVEEPVGTLAFGNYMDSAYLQRLTHLRNSEFAFVEADANEQILRYDIRRLNDQTISTFLPFQDIWGNDFLFQVSASRTIFWQSHNMVVWTAYLLIFAMIVLGVVLLLVIDRKVLSPIERLSFDLGELQGEALLEAVNYADNREFQALCDSINQMRRRIHQSRISIDVMQNILNGIRAYFYVTDLQTDEILFINEDMIKHFGLESPCIGKACWQIMTPDATHRCEGCPVDALLDDLDKPLVWEEYIEATGRSYRNTDSLIRWTGGRLVHLHHRMDITDEKIAEANLKRRLEQQELMSAVTQSFISTDEMDALIGQALERTGQFLDVGKILLLRYDEQSGQMGTVHAWRNAGQDYPDPLGCGFSFVPGERHYDAFYVHQDEFLACNDIMDEPAYCQAQEKGAYSFLSVPIWIDEACWGILSLNMRQAAHVWSASDIHLVKLIASVISGVVKRSQMEEGLIRMSSIAASAPQYIAYIDRNGRFEYFNEGALNLTGYSAQEFQEQGIGLLLDETTRQTLYGQIVPEILGHGIHNFELPILCKGGIVRDMLFSAFTTGAKSGGIGAIGVDMTERRRLERELIAAKEQAELASRAKGDFLSRMSHEMRTPMNAIIGMTSIAQSSGDAAKKEYCLDKIKEASNHLLGVINDILDMSKIEANKFELSYDAFELDKMLQRVCNVINFRIEEKKQSFHVEVDPRVPRRIVSDEQRLSQVITNLLSNAVKFTPDHGQVRLSVRVTEQTEQLCTLRIAVTDTGIGVSPEQQKRLFHSFEQADGGISRRFGGTGLGLAISKSIVEMMHGRIWVESSEGLGSCFQFEVRVEAVQETSMPSQAPLKDLRVLVVDSSQETLDYFVNFAQAVGFACKTARDARTAIKLLETTTENPFDIVFIDWNLPDMDGLKRMRQVRERYGVRASAIMISAVEWSDIEQDARDAGVEHCLFKPLFPSLIVDCITQCLGEGHTAQAAQESVNHRSRLSGMRLLLAEDVEINRIIVLAFLEDSGILVDCAEDGQEAVTRFAQDPNAYDLIFMDIHMPNMDGYEATRQIRALPDPYAQAIPIVAMTANVFREDIERCLEAGMNDHLGKPIDMEQLYEKLHKFLSGTTK